MILQLILINVGEGTAWGQRGFQTVEKTASPYRNVAVGFLVIFCTVEGFAGSSLGLNTFPAPVSVSKAFLSYSYHVQIAVWWYLEPLVHLTIAYVFTDELVGKLVSLQVGGLQTLLVSLELICLGGKETVCRACFGVFWYYFCSSPSTVLYTSGSRTFSLWLCGQRTLAFCTMPNEMVQ